VDSALRVVPVGMVGELCISGLGLARGYWNRADLTRQRFVESAPGLSGRLYRTGDLVRQTHSGELIFLGRLDRQVKVHGLRIESEEVEIVLRSHPEVTDVLVAAPLIDGEPTLVAYLQCPDVGKSTDTIQVCRRLVRERLPAYMCPSRFIPVPMFPRSSSGKIDLKRLPAPIEASSASRLYVEPRTPTERRVAELMMQVTRAPRLGVSDDFFHVGGHSLAAAQLGSLARELFRVELTIGDIFSHSTVESLAARVDALAQSGEELEEIPLIRLPRAEPIT
jgi:hypothetical protein